MINKKKYVYGGKKKGLGGLIGTGVGAVGGAFLGNPMLGAKLGGMAGSGIEAAVKSGQEKEQKQPVDYAESSLGYGYATGGYLDGMGNMMLPDQYTGKADMSTKKQQLKEGGYYAVKASETEGDEPKYPINSADDVRDAWKLRNHAKGLKISKEKLKNRIKRKAREYDVDLNTDSDKKAHGGYRQTHIEKNNPMKSPKKKKKGNLNVSDRDKSKSMSDMMLSPEQKVYMEHKGGTEKSIGQDATKFEGRDHEEGGIDIDKNNEVEDGETKDTVNGNEYVFSKRLKVPGTDKSFAEVHEEMVSNNASPADIQQLAELQEKVSGRKQ